MTVFQVLILLVIAIIVLKSFRKLLKKELSVWLFAIWVSFWLLVAVVDLFPVIINRLADLLGVGRGVDLIIYASILVLFYLVFRININLNKINKNFSKIVKEVSLRNSKEGK
ncbi:MAG: DUF2304 domain-containing protein [Patescibacteria group bacterium]